MSIMPWYFNSANISSLDHWESSLFLIIALEEFRVLWEYVIIFKLQKVFIFSKKFVFYFQFQSLLGHFLNF